MTRSLRTVEVPLAERAYRIDIGPALVVETGERLARLRSVSHAVVLTDSNVESPHAANVARSLSEAGMTVDMLVVEPGESTKCIEVADQLWQKLLELKADRKTVVVAVGGGVVGDLAGFVAATFARGLALFQVPTTLLAQVDSSVGGKVGVNLPGGKNMVGAFWQPLGVLIDTDMLQTLPEREYKAGLAEVVKYGVILDAEFFGWLEAHADELILRDAEAVATVVARSCELKAQVVVADEREETGQRAVLNYGHTFCHAFETLTGYETLLHGEAVSIGMMCAARLAERLGRIDASLTRRQHELLVRLGLPVAVPELPADEILAVMARDKKVEHGQLRFVLPSRLGHVELVGNVAEDDVRAALMG